LTQKTETFNCNLIYLKVSFDKVFEVLWVLHLKKIEKSLHWLEASRKVLAPSREQDEKRDSDIER